MTIRPHPRSCERAREWASLRLDGELSEFEQVWLATHLERCPDCAAYAHGVTAATGAIRGASPLRLSEPVTLPRSRRIPVRAVSAATAAAAIVAAVGLGTLIGSLGGTSRAFHPGVARASFTTQPSGEQALIQAPKLAMLRAKAGIGKQRGLWIADV